MEILFVDKDKNIEIKDISLDNILLSASNPRFSPMNSIDESIIDHIKKDIDITTQNNVFKKILSTEDNFADLLSLLKSVENLGFENENEPIYLINLENNKYVVAEGNRRIMCLKLIKNLLNFPDYDFLIKKCSEENQDVVIEENNGSIIQEQKDYSNTDILKNSSDNKKSRANYEACIETIKKIQSKQDLKFKLFFKVFNVDTKPEEKEKLDLELWSVIYDKHLTGNRQGMRRWSRSKYFVDLLKMFRDGISNDDIKAKNKQIFLRIKRDINVVRSDFRQAQFTYICIFYLANLTNYSCNFDGNFNDNEVLEKMINQPSISALEMTHSYIKIKKIFTEEILFESDQKKFDDEFFKISFDEYNNRIKIEPKKISEPDLFKFIVINWKNGRITTRDVSKNKFVNFVEDMKNYLLGSFDYSNPMTIEQIRTLDIFNLEIETVNKIFDINKFVIAKDKNLENKFEIVQKINKKIQDSLETIRKEISKLNDVDKQISNNLPDDINQVFADFFSQYRWNSKSKKFVHAISCTIRAFLETFLIFIWANWKNNSKGDNSNIYSENNDENWGDEFKKREMSKIFNMIRRQYFEYEKIKEMLTLIFKENCEEKIKSELTEKLKKLLFNKEGAESPFNRLNGFVHSYSLILFNKDINSHITDLCEYIDLFENIFKYIDFNKLRWIDKNVKNLIYGGD
ncbi:MAG: hypothetical protein HUJ42_03335 [Malacoplasma sp.]|nr:hypothetical protein [Malacoplasma sp.]